jgi:hypothetical protein
MARKDSANKIEFDSPATTSELIEALEDLRSRFGNDAPVRFVGFVGGMHILKGSYIKTITVDMTTDTKGITL